jgi:aminoglycoside phosphotransferase (APT) family kinase protein
MMRLFPGPAAHVARALADALGEPVAADALAWREWRWIAELPGERVAHLPPDDASAVRLARERRLLALIAPRVDFAVPRPLGPLDAPLDLRARVPGVSGPAGLAAHFRAIADPARAARLADDFARIAAGLHQALSAAELAALGPAPAPAWPMAAARLAALAPSLPGDLAARASEVVARYGGIEVAPADHALVHGDLGSHNFGFDDAGGVTGLFDFEEAAAGDRHRDFRYLPSYGEPAFPLALAAYATRTGFVPSLERVCLYHAATALSYLAWRADDPADHDRRSGRDGEQALAWADLAVSSALDGR